jgi:hypothetical protein
MAKAVDDGANSLGVPFQVTAVPNTAAVVPAGFTAGMTFVVQDPQTGVQVQVVVPEGVAAGQTIHVSIPIVGQVINRQDNALDLQSRVHEVVRNKQRLTVTDAWAYTRSLSPEQKVAAEYSGYKACVPVTCTLGLPTCCGRCCGAWFCGCKTGANNECLCIPWCCCGICLPIASCCCCSCERQESAWITRDKHGMMTSAIMLVDHERSSLAMYAPKCCSEELDQDPMCYCV